MRELYLHPVAAENHLAAIYRQALSEAVELYILSAYLRTWDTNLNINRGCRDFAFIVGMDFGITRKATCIKVRRWLQSRRTRFLVANGIKGFHPKALFWRAETGSYYGLVGSSNLSEAAQKSNYEANLFWKMSRKEFDEVRKWVADIEDRSTEVTPEWIKTYKEAKRHELRNLEARNKKNRTLTFLGLPKVKDAARVVRERRSKKRSFERIRRRLLAAIRQCASGKITNREFYKRLVDTWGSTGARAQNNRWQATGRRSNFKRLCRGLLAILASRPAMRDKVVLKTIDSLKRGKPVSTRRALLSELLCHFFPSDYPILDKPVAIYARRCFREARGLSEGAKYIHLAISLRATLKRYPKYPAKDLFELDGLIWEFVEQQAN